MYVCVCYLASLPITVHFFFIYDVIMFHISFLCCCMLGVPITAYCAHKYIIIGSFHLHTQLDRVLETILLRTIFGTFGKRKHTHKQKDNSRSIRSEYFSLENSKKNVEQMSAVEIENSKKK